MRLEKVTTHNQHSVDSSCLANTGTCDEIQCPELFRHSMNWYVNTPQPFSLVLCQPHEHRPCRLQHVHEVEPYKWTWFCPLCRCAYKHHYSVCSVWPQWEGHTACSCRRSRISTNRKSISSQEGRYAPLIPLKGNGHGRTGVSSPATTISLGKAFGSKRRTGTTWMQQGLVRHTSSSWCSNSITGEEYTSKGQTRLPQRKMKS